MIQEIIEKIEREIEIRKNMPHNSEQVDICYGLNRAREIVSSMREDGWIPVYDILQMERLRDHEDKYWCTFSDGTTGACLFMVWRNGGSFNIPASATRIDPSLSVIAWQPLPPAYQPPARQ